MTTSIYNTKFVIYKHTNTITQKSYIGKTVQSIKSRWLKHLSDSRNGSNFHFHKSIRKHGTDCWLHEILYVSFEKDDDHLYEVEEQLITDWDTFYNGYNSDGGGVGVNSGKLNPMYGKHHSEEAKRKISEKAKGKVYSEEYKKNMSMATLGKKLTQKHIKNISLSKIGVNHPTFCGYYMYKNNQYTSTNDMSIDLGVARGCISRWCKNNVLITKNAYSHSKFLQSLGTEEEIVGLTFKDLGFDFKPI